MEKKLPSSKQIEAELRYLRKVNGELEQALHIRIQENAQLQEKLRETDEVKRALDQHSIVAITDERGVIIYVNDKFCQLSGYSSLELTGQTYQMINSGFHPESFFVDLWQTISKGKVWQGQIRNRAKDGSFYWADITVSPLLNKDGKPYQYISIYTDITAQKAEKVTQLLNEPKYDYNLHSSDKEPGQKPAYTPESNNRISKSEEMFRAIASTPPVLLWMSDSSGNCIYLNQVWQDYTGKTFEEQIGKGWENSIHPDDLPNCLAVYRDAFEKKETFTMECRLRRHDGVYRWMLYAGGPRFRGDGSFLGYVSSLIDITQQKEAEERLKESEAKHRLITESMTDLICMQDTTGKFIFVTSSVKTILGYEPEALIGKTPFEFIHSDEAPYVENEFKRILEENGSTYVQYKFQKRNGKYIWLETIAQTVTNELGDVIQVHSASRDITARKQAEESLQLFQFSIENSSDAFFWINPDARILYVNNASCQLLGYTKEELLEMTVDAIDPIFRADVWADHWRELQAKGSMRFESMHRTKDGRIIPSEVSVTHMIFNGQEYNFAYTRDISERKASEQNLRFNNYILSLVRDAIIGIDTNNTVVYWNKAAEVQYGLPATEAIGKPLNECYQYEWLNDTDEQKAFDAIARSGHCHAENIHILKNGKKIYVESDVQQINFPESGLMGLFGVIRDITERKQAEENLKHTLDELKRRNYELDNYVYKVSHDLRAPLSSILGLINLIKQEEDPATITDYITLIENRINKSDQFIQSVLNHSRILNSQKKVSKIDFRKIISDSYEDLKYIANSEKLHLQINITGESAFYNDAFRLDIIFKNFISNAIKYMNPYTDYSYLRFDIQLIENEALIRIEDNGIGIEKNYMGNIFDMFFRATEKSDGSGLGLYIVKQTLDRIGGTINVASEFGKGTTFTITLQNDLVGKLEN
jgi:PAS domain S-box-containing protein